MGKFKLSALMLAMFAASSALAAAESEAQATVNPQLDEDLEVIEVTGFSRSLIQSLNQKRFTDTVSCLLYTSDAADE